MSNVAHIWAHQLHCYTLIHCFRRSSIFNRCMGRLVRCNILTSDLAFRSIAGPLLPVERSRTLDIGNRMISCVENLGFVTKLSRLRLLAECRLIRNPQLGPSPAQCGDDDIRCQVAEHLQQSEQSDCTEAHHCPLIEH